eukprot:1049927_1
MTLGDLKKMRDHLSKMFRIAKICFIYTTLLHVQAAFCSGGRVDFIAVVGKEYNAAQESETFADFRIDFPDTTDTMNVDNDETYNSPDGDDNMDGKNSQFGSPVNDNLQFPDSQNAIGHQLSLDSNMVLSDNSPPTIDDKKQKIPILGGFVYAETPSQNQKQNTSPNNYNDFALGSDCVILENNRIYTVLNDNPDTDPFTKHRKRAEKYNQRVADVAMVVDAEKIAGGPVQYLLGLDMKAIKTFSLSGNRSETRRRLQTIIMEHRSGKYSEKVKKYSAKNRPYFLVGQCSTELLVDILWDIQNLTRGDYFQCPNCSGRWIHKLLRKPHQIVHGDVSALGYVI